MPITLFAAGYLRQNSGGLNRIRAICVHNNSRMSPNRASKVLSFFKRHPDLPRVTCSSMRHSFATSAIHVGVSIAWLGHANITTNLNRYVKPLETDLRSAAEQIQLLYFEAGSA